MNLIAKSILLSLMLTASGAYAKSMNFSCQGAHSPETGSELRLSVEMKDRNPALYQLIEKAFLSAPSVVRTTLHDVQTKDKNIRLFYVNSPLTLVLSNLESFVVGQAPSRDCSFSGPSAATLHSLLQEVDLHLITTRKIEAGGESVSVDNNSLWCTNNLYGAIHDPVCFVNNRGM